MHFVELLVVMLFPVAILLFMIRAGLVARKGEQEDEPK